MACFMVDFAIDCKLVHWRYHITSEARLELVPSDASPSLSKISYTGFVGFWFTGNLIKLIPYSF
jgi:hypothetical protein